MQIEFAPIEQALKGLILVGGSIMAVAYGIRRVYRIARNIDKLVERSDIHEAHRAQMLETIAHRDAQMADLNTKVNVILREVMPNGGSSMKDVVNQTNARVHDIHARVAVLEQWKEDVA